MSKQQNSVARLSLKEDVVFAHGSPIGFRHVMSDKRNYRKLRNQTFIFAKYTRKQIDEQGKDSNSFIWKDDNPSGEFIWPLTKFNEFVIEALTRKPIRPKTILSLITDFNLVNNSNLTIEEGTQLFNDLFSYIKNFRSFFFKHKSTPSFALTCCSNLYTVTGSLR